MPDNETKITLTGEDKTAPMFKGASKNAADYIKQLEKILNINESTRRAMEATRRTTHQTYTEQLENVYKHRRALDETADRIKKNGQEGASAFKKQESAAHLLTGELASMVGGYLSVSAAIQTATKAFMGFADQQRRVNQLRNATDVTKDAAQGTIKQIEQMAQDSATSVAAANEAFTTLREGLNLTSNETLKILPRVMAQAQASNSSLGTFSKTFAEYARALKLPQEDYGKGLEQMTYLANELGVNLDKAGGSAEKLGTWANRWGQTGIKGMASMNAVVAESSKLFGNSERGASVAAQLMERLSSDQMGQQMQKPAGVWIRELDKVKARGGNVYGYMISRVQDLMTAEQRRRVLSLEEQELLNHLIEKNDGSMARLTAEIEKQSGGFKGLAQALNVMNDQRGGIEKLNSSLQILLNTVGDLLDKLGISDAMTIFNEQLIDLNHTIDELKKGNWGVLTERTGTPGHTTIFGGMDAAGLLERGRGRVQKRLEATMSEDEKKEFRRQLKIQQDKAAPQATLPGLKEPGIPAPPGYDGFKPMSFNQGGGPTPSGGAMPGGVTPAVYGGSADSAYLPAGYKQNASFVTQGQAGATDRSFAGPAYQNAGPAGPGAGTSYGGQRDIKTAKPAENSKQTVDAAQAGDASATLAAQRAPLMEEVNKDPATKKLLHQMMATEGGGAATVEALVNRTAMIRQKIPGYSIKDELNSGFYGPIKKGIAQQRNVSEAEAKKFDSDIDKVAKGSNIIKGRTDQGSGKDPNVSGPGRIPVAGSNEVYNYWQGRRKGVEFGYRDSAAYADKVAKATTTPEGGTKTASVGPPGTGTGGNDSIPSQFTGAVTSLMANGAGPKDIQAYLSANGVNTNIPTCGQFMATVVRKAGGKPPADSATASSWNKFGQEGFNPDPNAINVAIDQRVKSGPGAHVAAAVPIKDASGKIIGYNAVGVNQGRAGVATAKGDYGRNIITSRDITKQVQSGRYKIRSYVPPKQDAPAATPDAPAVARTQDAPPVQATGDDEQKPRGDAPDDAPRSRSRREMMQVDLKVNDNDVQFARTSMKRQADREVREARWNSYSDIGAA